MNLPSIIAHLFSAPPPAAVPQFKKINEAYAVLGDEEKRKQYDQVRVATTRPRRDPAAIHRAVCIPAFSSTPSP